jgi:hypothetical protein
MVMTNLDPLAGGPGRSPRAELMIATAVPALSAVYSVTGSLTVTALASAVTVVIASAAFRSANR